jgi:hypothetical protein
MKKKKAIRSFQSKKTLKKSVFPHKNPLNPKFTTKNHNFQQIIHKKPKKTAVN